MGLTNGDLTAGKLGNGANLLNGPTPGVLDGILKRNAEEPTKAATGQTDPFNPLTALKDMMANFANAQKGYKPGVLTSNSGVTTRAATASTTAGAY